MVRSFFVVPTLATVGLIGCLDLDSLKSGRDAACDGACGTCGDPAVDRDSDGDGYTDDEEIRLGEDPCVYCAIMRADIDNNGQVNIIDAGKISDHFGEVGSSRYDQDGDNIVAGMDVTILVAVYGKQVAECP